MCVWKKWKITSHGDISKEVIILIEIWSDDHVSQFPAAPHKNNTLFKIFSEWMAVLGH